MKIANIIVKQGALRSQPSFIGQMLTNLSYGESVEISQEANGWAKIRVIKTGQTGWVHLSALSKDAMTLKSVFSNSGNSTLNHSATTDELALAGKGFNKQVENQYKSRNPNIDFSWIDKMEHLTISDIEIQRFLQEGQIYPIGGQS